MNTQIAIVLGLVILSLLCLDGFLNQWDALVFLLRKFAALTEWLAFWR
ncbi:hypothetical protein KO498_12005 [Lentibacter algarum]|nr:hypothetical protein [Lentibacter algarum]MBU2982533.1 hypothetical protein [Lentibacter algarum]